MRLRLHSAAFPLALLAACTMAGGGATSTSEAMPPATGPAIAATSME
ncbi:MAG: hypothetical protein HOQ19_07825, partial [Gemmatimonadaceae bacterium]|nr:hypothetical protein [Gemmatimonadaceae bacterium]